MSFERWGGLIWGFSVGYGLAASMFVHPAFAIVSVFAAFMCWSFGQKHLALSSEQREVK